MSLAPPNPRLARILFPSRAADPLASLVLRIGLALAIWLLVAGVTWLGRDGYRDIDGTAVTFLDSIYYASVTVTTTGYGDITPVSAAARSVTAIVVTPARILFLIILVGTTIEVLTQRFRQTLAVSRWRTRMRNHVIVVGFGTKGRGAVASLLANDVATPDDIVVIDRNGNAVEDARNAGLTAIAGDATRTQVLRQALIERARAVIVTCHADDTATLVTLTARELNPTAVIVSAAREAENVHLLEQSGANTVVVSSEASGRILGLATMQPSAVAVIDDILVAGRGLELIERLAGQHEVGHPPERRPAELPIAIVRRGERISFDDERFSSVEPGDIVVSLTTVPVG